MANSDCGLCITTLYENVLENHGLIDNILTDRILVHELRIPFVYGSEFYLNEFKPK